MAPQGKASSFEILVKTFPFKGEYFVTQPLAVVSATKMNVIYRAILNPISVSVPGFD
jgi:hypothetical protein